MHNTCRKFSKTINRRKNRIFPVEDFLVTCFVKVPIVMKKVCTESVLKTYDETWLRHIPYTEKQVDVLRGRFLSLPLLI